MSLTIRDVHVPGGLTRPRRKRHVLFLKAFPGFGGDHTLSQAEHAQRVNAARRSAEVRRRLGAAAGKGGRAALIAAIGAGALGSLTAPVRERRAAGVTDGQERVSRLAGYFGAGIGGLAGGLAGGGFGSMALGIAGATAGQELFERGTLALFGRDRRDMARRFTEGNRLETPGASLGGGLGTLGGYTASYLLNRTTPGKALRLGRDLLMPVAGGALGAEVGRNLEGRGFNTPEVALGAGALAGLTLFGRGVKGLGGVPKTSYSALPPALSNERLFGSLRGARPTPQRFGAGLPRLNLKRRLINGVDGFRQSRSQRGLDPEFLFKSNLTEAEREQRRNAARARWANHTPVSEPVEERSAGRRVRDAAITAGIGAAALGLGVSLIGLLARRPAARGGKAMRLLAARAARSQAKTEVGRLGDLNRRINHMETTVASGQLKSKDLKRLQTRLSRLEGERSNLEGRAGRARELLATTFRAKLTTPGLKRTASNALSRFKKFDHQLSGAEIEQRRAAGRASAAARRARAQATEVITPTPKINEAISPGFFTRDNLITGALGGAALGGLFALSRGRLKAKEAARTTELSISALRRTMPQAVEEMRAGVRGAERLAADAGLFRLMSRGVAQNGDDLAAAGRRAEQAIQLADEARRSAGNNVLNLPEGMRGAPRTPGAPNLFAGQSTGTVGGDADLSSRLGQVARWARTAIGREQNMRMAAGPGKGLVPGSRDGMMSPGLRRLASAADAGGDAFASKVEGTRLTLKPLNSRRVSSIGNPNLELRNLTDKTFIEPSTQRQVLGMNRRDRLATQAIDDITDAEAEQLLRTRADQFSWMRNRRKLEAMRGTTALSDWGQVKGQGFQMRRAGNFNPMAPKLGGLRNAFGRTRAGALGVPENPSTLYVTPSSRSEYSFGGALSDPTSPFRRGRYSRS